MKDTLDCGCRFDITDLEMIDNHETIDRIRDTSEGRIEWEGKIESPMGIFRFKFVKFWTEDNGSEGATIISPKTDISDELEQEMIDYIENEYRHNRQEWEALE